MNTNNMNNINTVEYWDQVYDQELKDGLIRNNIHNIRFFDQYIEKCDSFLDVGCGTGGFIKYLKDTQKINPAMITGVDFSDKALRFVKRTYGTSVIQGDVRDLHFLTQIPGADLVTCLHTLEHIENIKEVTIFLHALAKKYLIIALPLRDPWKEHLYVFEPSDVKHLFRDYNAKFYQSNLDRGNGLSSEMIIVIEKEGNYE